MCKKKIFVRRRRRLTVLSALVLFAAQLIWAQVDFTTLSNKVMTGYQGWHWATGDRSPHNKWNHWITNSNVRPGPTNCHMDAFPDMTEYTKQYDTDFYTPGGTRMKVYSATDYSTVDLHFKWMKDYNIDGAFVQRFVSRFKTWDSKSQNTELVMSNCWKAAEAHGRAFVVMYDVSDSWNSDAQLYTTLTNDWIQRAKKYTTNSPNYLYHKGKPLAVVWGMGKADRWPESPKVAMDIVNFFKTNGCSVMGGVDNDWRMLGSGCRTNVVDGISWTDVNNAYDVISPWLVGTFGAGVSSANGIRTKLSQDVQNCNARNVDYMPVAFPGFSWANWKPGAVFNSRPRLGGTYLWAQAYNAKLAGANMLYLAMFDEVDEATALYKTTPTAETSPQVVFGTGYTNQWVRLNIDGQTLPSDWYLQVCDEINRMFKGERTVVETLPISPNSGPVITSIPVTSGIVDRVYAYTLTVADGETNALSYSAITLPAWLSFNTNTALLSGTPSMMDVGAHPVTLQVSDGAERASQSFTVWVGTMLLAVDLHQNTSDLVPLTPDYFTGWMIGNVDAGVAAPSTSMNGYVVTVGSGSSVACLTHPAMQAGLNARSRSGYVQNSGAFTQAELMRERIASLVEPINPSTGNGTGNGIYLSISGLEPNTPYVIQTWGADSTGDNPNATLKNGYNYGFDATLETAGYASLPLLGSYTVSGSPSVIANNNQYSVTGVITADTNGTIVYKQISNIDKSVMNGFVLSAVSRSELSGYDAWAATNEVGAATADEDGDGRNNFYEYVFGGDPNSGADTGTDPVLVNAADGLDYIYLRRNDDPSLIYIAQIRTNLVSGVWITAGGSALTNVIGGAYDEVRHRIPMGDTKSYIRLKITNH